MRSPEPKNQSSYSLYFLWQDQFPTTQIPFKFVTFFFSGKLFRLRFSDEALNGFVFLCWISQCRSYHTFVQKLFAACAVSWLQSLAIHSSI